MHINLEDLVHVGGHVFHELPVFNRAAIVDVQRQPHVLKILDVNLQNLKRPSHLVLFQRTVVVNVEMIERLQNQAKFNGPNTARVSEERTISNAVSQAGECKHSEMTKLAVAATATHRLGREEVFAELAAKVDDNVVVKGLEPFDYSRMAHVTDLRRQRAQG